MKSTLFNKAYAYVEKASALLPEGHRDAEYFIKFLENMPKAAELADIDEKRLLMEDTAVKVANQISFILFREKLLTAELENEYRELPGPEKTTANLEAVTKKRTDAAENVAKAVQGHQNAQKDIDIFVQVMGGLSKEEAEKRYEDYVKAGGR